VPLGRGQIIGTLPFEWTEATRGPAGGQWLSGRDSTGFLEVTMQVDPTYRGGFTICAPARNDVLPGEALPVLRFIHQLRRADHVQLRAPGQETLETRVTGEPTGMPDTTTLILVAETLSHIQEATGTAFPLPRS
jgi:hypothetical protein